MESTTNLSRFFKNILPTLLLLNYECFFSFFDFFFRIVFLLCSACTKKLLNIVLCRYTCRCIGINVFLYFYFVFSLLFIDIFVVLYLF